MDTPKSEGADNPSWANQGGGGWLHAGGTWEINELVLVRKRFTDGGLSKGDFRTILLLVGLIG